MGCFAALSMTPVWQGDEKLTFWLFQVGAGFDVGLEAFGDEMAPDSIKSLGGWLVNLAGDVHGDPELRACGIGQKFVGRDAINCHA